MLGDVLTDIESFTKRIDHLPDQHLWPRCTSSNANGCRCAQPLPIDVGGPLDQAGGGAAALGDLGKSQRVAAVGSADDQQPVAFGSDRLDRGLAVGRGVANVLAPRSEDR